LPSHSLGFARIFENSQIDTEDEARPLHLTNLRQCQDVFLTTCALLTRARRAPVPFALSPPRYRGPFHKGADHFMRDDQPRTGTAVIFALTDDAWNNIKVQVERTGVEIVIAERNQVAGLTLPSDQVVDLHRALGRYLQGK
jgi:hypothetical protein